MRVCLLTQHPHLFTQQRLVSELREFKIEADVIRPENNCWVLPNSAIPYDLTFNRLSSVESGPFETALSSLPRWGTQVNSWDLRLKLWDKARQIIWLNEYDLEAPPSMMIKGPIDQNHLAWKEFVSEHSTGHGWVMKFNRGQKGIGVNFIESEKALFDWVNTLFRMGDQDFLIQPKLSQDQEYRLTLLGGKPWCLLKRYGEKGNFAQGATAEEVTPGNYPKGIQGLIDRLSDLGDTSYLAIDIIMVNHRPYILDVNTMPGVEQLETVSGRNFIKDLIRLSLKSY